ncbi:MAG TPA: PKD domain-containing protein [Solirubrobacterales bacterium]|nr:PKD domain-containing protein [Solirubrobacterales bacterium]
MVSSRPNGGSSALFIVRGNGIYRAAVALALMMLALAILASAAHAATPTTSLISLSSTAVKSNGFSAQPSVTPDGRYVLFWSNATNLVSPPLPSPVDNFYLRDRARGTTTLIAPTDTNGSVSRISADGRWVVFESKGPGLPGANGAAQVYLWDRETGISRRLSSNTGSGQVYEGIHEVDISDDGSRVVYSAFDNDAGGRDDTFFVQLPSGTVRRLGEPSPGVGPTASVNSPRISGDGQWAVYATAEKLEAADTNGVSDIYRENLDTGAKQRVSVTANGGVSTVGSFSPEADRDGCVIAFNSAATDMAPGASDGANHTFVRDVCQNTTEVVSIGNDGKAGASSTSTPQISDDGCSAAFRTAAPILSPTPTATAVGVRDRCAGVTTRVDVSTAGAPGDGAVGPGGFSMAGGEGRYVAFASAATNLAPGDGDAEQDIFLRDRANNVGPTIAVTTSQSANRVSVDLSGSRDPDGFQLTGATSFGDGSPEVPGLVVSHDYPRAGTYTIALTVTDADGASSRDYRTVTVTDPPPSGGGGGVVGPGGGSGRAGALKLSAKLSRTHFAVAPAHGKAGAGQGATLTATLSAAATLTLTFERQRNGHRAKGKCVAGAGKPRCKLKEKVGTLTKAVGAGSSQIALTGRLGSKALPPGPYQLVIEAKAGGDSAKTTLSFTVSQGGKR